MKSLQIGGAEIAVTRSLLSLDLVSGALRRRLNLGVCFLCIGTAAAMGSGSGGGSGSSAESPPSNKRLGVRL